MAGYYQRLAGFDHCSRSAGFLYPYFCGRALYGRGYVDVSDAGKPRAPDRQQYKYFFTEPKKGEIVVFRYPKDESRDFIKRVIATGGDTIEMRDGKVLVNGSVIEENLYLQG